MRISCVIVSYNNGDLLENAVMSVVKQTRPLDEIIIADDASADGSQDLIDALSHAFPNINPIIRERNLGVSANRDLAMREAHGDFVTYLDGDDHFLPTKIEAEARAVRGHPRVIGYSDVTIIDRSKDLARTASIADFSRLEASERVSWLLKRTRQSPAAMLIPKDVHLRVGGYNHSLRTYEDWDYILRLAAQPLYWAHSGTEGLAHHPGGGLSRQRPIEHVRDELRVLHLNQGMARRHVGLPLLLVTAGRVVGSRSKWWIVGGYRQKKVQLAQRRERYRQRGW
jgi:glycosyltransferase involved in cell wall biosynthesis